MSIQIIPSSLIDKARWDACVTSSGNGLIYANSGYLDAMADNWSGVVVGDYEAVMALPWRRKWGITYLYTPPFTQQLGLIGEASVTMNELKQQIINLANYGDYLFNYENSGLVDSLKAESCNNYFIDLQRSYEEIKVAYRKSFQKNVNRASHQELFYSNSSDVDEATALFYQYNKTNIGHVEPATMARFTQLCKQLQQSEKVIIRKVTNTEGALLSIVLLLTDEKRYYNIINFTSDAGRQCESNYFLYDQLFKELAGCGKLFDLEGSDLPGVKAFYESMGGLNQPYTHWHYNELPWFLKLIKK